MYSLFNITTLACLELLLPLRTKLLPQKVYPWQSKHSSWSWVIYQWLFCHLVIKAECFFLAVLCWSRTSFLARGSYPRVVDTTCGGHVTSDPCVSAVAALEGMCCSQRKVFNELCFFRNCADHTDLFYFSCCEYIVTFTTFQLTNDDLFFHKSFVLRTDCKYFDFLFSTD